MLFSCGLALRSAASDIDCFVLTSYSNITVFVYAPRDVQCWTCGLCWKISAEASPSPLQLSNSNFHTPSSLRHHARFHQKVRIPMQPNLTELSMLHSSLATPCRPTGVPSRSRCQCRSRWSFAYTYCPPTAESAIEVTATGMVLRVACQLAMIS